MFSPPLCKKKKFLEFKRLPSGMSFFFFFLMTDKTVDNLLSVSSESILILNSDFGVDINIGYYPKKY